MFNFDFDLSNGYVILRIICGAFFIPHAVGKIRDRAGITGFYQAARLHPVGLWINTAIAAELVMSTCLILGIFTQYAAAAATVFLVVAVLAVLRVSKGKWLWNLGGCEYPLFWAICCAIVVMHPS
ncbi:MAG TPA: DoxX family protein [Caulobacteraceae bacterium]|jgi:putative oxidoreductase|nr:DoxX family protein [Caulobacteraceae bacterium]